MQVWREFNDHCHVATYVSMTARFPVDELYFQRHLSRYQQAIAKALFIGDASEDDFRITVVSITQFGLSSQRRRSLLSLSTAEIQVQFRIQVPDVDAPSNAVSPALAAPVLGKMTDRLINFELTSLDLVTALEITDADIVNMNSFSGIHGPHARAPAAPAPRSCLPGPRPAAAVGHVCGTLSSLSDC